VTHAAEAESVAGM